MTWKTGGYVGISNTDPIRKLDVAGTIGFKGLQGSGGVGGAVADFTKHTWIENNTSSNGATWHKVGTFTLPDNPYSGISLMVETVYPGSNHGGYDYNGHVWFNKVSVQRNGSTNGTVELDTGSVQGPESSKLRLHRNSVSEWELQIRSVIDNQSLYADITQLSSAGSASFSLEQSITAGSTGGTTITSPHTFGSNADNDLTHTFGQLRTSGRIRANGTIIANGVGSYDPEGDGLDSNDGVDTATNAAIAIPRGKRIVGTYDGYIRNIIEWNSNTNMNIGQTGTALLNNINLNSGHSGHVKIQNSRSAIAATEGNSGSTTQYAKLIIKDGWNSSETTESDDWVANQIIAAVEFDSSDSNGNSGGDSSPRGTINLVSETTDASATALTFATKGNATGAPSERLRITSAGNVGIGPFVSGTTDPARKLHVLGSGTTVATMIEASDTNQASVDLKNSNSWFRLIAQSGEFYVYDQGDNAERFRIDTAGNVGIGTDSPESLLNVVHQITANEYQYPLVVSGIDAGNTVDQTTSSGIGMQFKLANNHTDGQSMPGAAIVAVRENDNDDRNETSLVFQTSAHDQNLAEYIRIKSNGKVGIGTNDPTSPLHVEKAITGDDSQLTITNGAGAALRFGITGSGANENAHIKTHSGEDLEFHIGQASDSALPSVIFKSGGKVGIGTNDPTSQFQSITYGIDTNATPITATN